MPKAHFRLNPVEAHIYLWMAENIEPPVDADYMFDLIARQFPEFTVGQIKQTLMNLAHMGIIVWEPEE